MHPNTQTAAAAYQVSHSLSLDTTPTLTPCKTIVQPSHTRAVRCHAVTCMSCELVDAQALSTHRSRVLIRRQLSLLAYTRVTNFCHIFGRGNGGRLIRGTAYTRVYMVDRIGFSKQKCSAMILLNGLFVLWHYWL